MKTAESLLMGGLLVLVGIVSGFSQEVTLNSSWKEIQQKHQGTLAVYWYTSNPFIYRDEYGVMKGIEYDLILDFKQYLKDKKNIDLTLDWQEGQSFAETYDIIREKKNHGAIGVSSFSITAKRLQEVEFSPPYMSDISVLITSKNIPIAKTIEELNLLLPKLTAITIKGTTYEQELKRLQTLGDLPFKFQYIGSSENIVDDVAATDSAFGFVDLPIYMILFDQNPSLNVKRQNLFPIKHQGYGIIYPKGSDWAEPLMEYFTNPDFKWRLEKIITKYIDLDLYHFVEGLAVQSDEQMVMLLTKEKEIQYKDLLDKTQQIVKGTRQKNFLIAFVGVTLVFLVAVAFLYRKQIEQKEKIEAQRQSIVSKSEQLEKRNQHLLALDEEKNHLIKILAHDLRTPINHIQGIAQVVLLENTHQPEEQKVLIRKIMDASARLNKMITQLLDVDALESNRVTVFMEKIPVSELVQNVVHSFEKQALRKNIKLLCDTQSTNSMILGDSLFLTQILENLISNAIKFSHPGMSVEITVLENQGKISIRVKDHGPGLTEEDRQHIFKKFQRLSAQPTAGESSLGLGLSIVKRYTEMMHGNVWCESMPNQGATFIVEFNKA
ncbi:MAG: ATP-binding protein [Bacteroidota bacterium]